jgi:hypothetical protein
MQKRLIEIPGGPSVAIDLHLELQTFAEHGQLTRLLNGEPKAFIVFWCGDPASAMSDFDPSRGDGQSILVTRNEPGYCLPPRWKERDINFRMSIPTWLLITPSPRIFGGQEVTVLGVGATHPLYNSCNLQLYHPLTGELQSRRYKVDPRQLVDEVNFAEEQRHITEMCGPLTLPRLAPAFYP